MPTYASPKIIKYTLLSLNSFIFIIGCFIVIEGIIEVINSLPKNKNQTSAGFDKELVNDVPSTVTPFEDQFPSVGSPSVIIIFGMITMSVSALGVTATNKEDHNLLTAYSFVLLMASFTRFLFLLATISMHLFHVHYDPISITTLVSAGIAMVELILVMCVCHFARIIKRGDAALPHIPKLPSTSIKQI